MSVVKLFSMNAIYFSNYDLSDSTSGVSKKILMQLDAFKRNGVNIYAPALFSLSTIDKIIKKLPILSSDYYNKLYKYINNLNNEDIKFVYFRHDTFTRLLIFCFRLLKSKNIKILYEIPTFPYDNNENHFKNFFVRLKDKFWRKFAHKYIDYIVDYSGYRNIFGVKTITISNGYDISFTKPIGSNFDGKTINIIGVALLDKIHGFDRLIKSLANAEGSNFNIDFHIVGNGDAYNYLYSLTNVLKLNKRVHFYGYLSGDSLDSIYNKCDIAVGPLGLHRRPGNNTTSSLKTKEYSSKGLPFIMSGYDKQFDSKDCDFVYYIEANDNSFDINKIILWYLDLIKKYKTKQKLIEKIREYTKRYLSWDIQIEKIIKECLLNE